MTISIVRKSSDTSIWRGKVLHDQPRQDHSDVSEKIPLRLLENDRPTLTAMDSSPSRLNYVHEHKREDAV